MTQRHMPPPLRFLLAARRSELQGLEALSRNCDLVVRIGALAHALQKERGYSNLCLCSADASPRPALAGLSAQAETIEAEVRQLLDGLADTGSASARLLNAIAHALFRLDELGGLRREIRDRRVPAEEADERFTRTVGSLLAIVFEAADAALDPAITRGLVALLNFMQGKELSGQERACGVMGYTAGHFTDTQKARMLALCASQERSFGSFSQYAEPEALQCWERLQRHGQQVARMRGMAQRTSAGQRVDPGLAELWFELCTARIDAMRSLENLLADALARRCEQRIAGARQELEDRRLLLERHAGQAGGGTPGMVYGMHGRIMDAPPPDGMADGLERSLLDMMREQALRLQRADDALAASRGALDDARLVDRAKLLLIARHGVTERAAHERLQRTAMERGLPMAEVARQALEPLEEKRAPGGEPARAGN
ncbi:nitrate- and nitrite sensing domain-containing protein [Achromobacter denitrificans]